MSRLTEKVEGAYYKYSTIEIGKYIVKLGKLEDIEEELEVDLFIFLKAIIKGIYFLEHKKMYLKYDFPPSILKYNKKEKCFEEKIQDMGASWVDKYYLKDYGKTWVVNKEELLCEK